MVSRFVVIGEGIHVLAAILFDELAEFVGDDVLIGLGNGVFPRLFQLLESGFITAHALVALGDVGGISGLHFFQGHFLRRVVLGADFIGTLESHVLEHVGQPGFSQGVLRRSRVHHGKEREYRSLGPFTDENDQAVVELLDRNALLEGCDVLSCGEDRKK